MPWRLGVPHSALASVIVQHCLRVSDQAANCRLWNTSLTLSASLIAMEEAALNRLATSITRLTLSQVTADEIDAATKLLDKACQKLRGIPDVPHQRITDLETAIRQLSCILDSCTIAASYEVSQAQKALLLMPRTARGASTSSGELNAQGSLPIDDEYHAPQNQDQRQEH